MKPPSESGTDSVSGSYPAFDDLVDEARYQVMLTDFSSSRASIEKLVLQHTKIPADEIEDVLAERPAIIADAVTRAEADRLHAAFSGSGANIQILARPIPGIEDVLDEFLLASDASSVLLMDRAGFIICQRGEEGAWEVDQITGLIAGVFAATKRIATFLGEEDFGALFHPGNDASIFLSLVGERGVLVTQFDNRTTMRIVRLYATEAATRLARVL